MSIPSYTFNFVVSFRFAVFAFLLLLVSFLFNIDGFVVQIIDAEFRPILAVFLV